MGLLAEQVLIDCPPSRLEELLCHRPATWMVPLLRLAGDEGEAAGLALLGRRAADDGQVPRVREHHVVLRPPERVDGAVRVALRWRAGDYLVLFAELRATMEVRSLLGHSILAVEGRFSGPPHPPETPLPARATRRAAEAATRSLLAHLRSAVEEQPDSGVMATIGRWSSPGSSGSGPPP